MLLGEDRSRAARGSPGDFSIDDGRSATRVTAVVMTMMTGAAETTTTATVRPGETEGAEMWWDWPITTRLVGDTVITSSKRSGFSQSWGVVGHTEIWRKKQRDVRIYKSEV